MQCQHILFLICFAGAFTRLPRQDLLEEEAPKLALEELQTFISERDFTDEESQAVEYLCEKLSDALKKKQLKTFLDFLC